jgi:hypothetical protein
MGGVGIPLFLLVGYTQATSETGIAVDGVERGVGSYDAEDVEPVEAGRELPTGGEAGILVQGL